MSKQIQDAYIVAATRTPVGKAPRGVFRNTRPDDMLAHVLRSVVAQAPGIDVSRIDDAVIGCAMPDGEQGMNIARINSAHDGPDEWQKMIANVHKAERTTGQACQIYFDLAGPKIRTILLGKGRRKGRLNLSEQEPFLLAEANAVFDKKEKVVGCTLPGVVQDLRPGGLERSIRYAMQHRRAEEQRIKVDVVTARALAPMDRLLGYAQPYLQRGAQGLFLKGEKAEAEVSDLKARSARAVQFLDARHNRNHWAETIQSMIQGA